MGKKDKKIPVEVPEGFQRGASFLHWLSGTGMRVEAQLDPFSTLTLVSVLNMAKRNAPDKKAAGAIGMLIDELLESFDRVDINGVCLGATIRETVGSLDGHPLVAMPKMVPIAVSVPAPSAS
jgi:hypothetical protein